MLREAVHHIAQVGCAVGTPWAAQVGAGVHVAVEVCPARHGEQIARLDATAEAVGQVGHGGGFAGDALAQGGEPLVRGFGEQVVHAGFVALIGNGGNHARRQGVERIEHQLAHSA